MSANVRHLDTVNFDRTITEYAKYIKQFQEIVEGVNRCTNTMVDNWEGKGRDAFEKDVRQVQLNLIDISNIMYEIRDALIQGHAAYLKNDAAVAKKFES